MHKADNVAVAAEDAAPGEILAVGPRNVAVKDPIPKGHKFAVKDIAKGEAVVKYGVQIGAATAFIAAGEHVHCHNITDL